MSSLYLHIVGTYRSGKTAFAKVFDEYEIMTTGGGSGEYSSEKRRVARDDVDDLILVGHRKYHLAFSFIWAGNERLLGDPKPHKNLGYIVIIDVQENEHDPDPVLAAKNYVNIIQQRGYPYIVVVNKMDRKGAYSVEQIRQMLELDDSVPMFGCSAEKDPKSVYHAVIGLLKLMPDNATRWIDIVNKLMIERFGGEKEFVELGIIGLMKSIDFINAISDVKIPTDNIDPDRLPDFGQITINQQDKINLYGQVFTDIVPVFSQYVRQLCSRFRMSASSDTAKLS